MVRHEQGRKNHVKQLWEGKILHGEIKGGRERHLSNRVPCKITDFQIPLPLPFLYYIQHSTSPHSSITKTSIYTHTSLPKAQLSLSRCCCLILSLAKRRKLVEGKTSPEKKENTKKGKNNREKERREEEKMSWQTYIDDHLMCDIDGNHLTAAAILGHDGSVWAQSPSFPQVNYYLDLKMSVIEKWSIYALDFIFVVKYQIACMICHAIVDLDSAMIPLEVFILRIESLLVVRFVKSSSPKTSFCLVWFCWCWMFWLVLYYELGL